MKVTRICGVAWIFFAALSPGQAQQQYNIATIVGDGTAGTESAVGDGGPPLQAQLNLPFAVVLAGGNLYIADEADDRIRFVTNGNITTVAGIGTAGYTGDNGAANAAQLDAPSGIAVDSKGDVFIADTPNSVIRYVASTGGIITLPINATFNLPSGLALDSAGNLYISNTGSNQIFKVTNPQPLTTQQVTTCTATPTATGCPFVTLIAGIGVVPGDYSGDGGPAVSAELNNPEAITLDAAGNLYIADTGNHRIRMVSTATGKITTIAGTGNPGFSGDGGAATSATLNYPEGVAVDGAGNIYIADAFNNRIRVVSNGIIRTIAGTGASGYTGDNGVATQARLFQPGCVTVGSAGSIYVCDTKNNVIRQLTPTVLSPPVLSAVENSASGGVRDATHPIAANSYLSIYATNIGTGSSAGNIFPSGKPGNYNFDGVEVLINGASVPLYNVTVTPTFSLINTMVPSNLPTTGTVTVTVQTVGGTSSKMTVGLAPADVGIFRLSADPAHPNNGAVTIAGTAWLVMPASTADLYQLSSCDGLSNTDSCGQPAHVGDNISIYFTGGGLATPNGSPNGNPVPTGTLSPTGGSVLYQTVLMPTVKIGGLSAPVLGGAAAIAPGTGSEYQLNATIPAGVQPGDSVPVVITFGSSSDTVTISVQ